MKKVLKILEILKITFFNILSIEYRVDSKKVKFSMYGFFMYKEDFRYAENISSIFVTKCKDETFVYVETYRIGILIGKKGRFIKALTEWVSEDLGISKSNIKFILSENKTWDDIY